jgi:hypothetical protein
MNVCLYVSQFICNEYFLVFVTFFYAFPGTNFVCLALRLFSLSILVLLIGHL